MLISGEVLKRMVEIIEDPVRHILNANSIAEACVCTSGPMSAVECELTGILFNGDDISLEYKIFVTQEDAPTVLGTKVSVPVNY